MAPTTHLPQRLRGPRWLILGGGPSLSWGLEPACRMFHRESLGSDCPGAIRIACNGAIERCLAARVRLTAGWLSDSRAVERYRPAMLEMCRRGALWLTNHHAVRDNPVVAAEADCYIEVGEWGAQVREGEIVNGRTSGSLVMQLAAARGAREIGLVGCDGYTSEPSKQRVDYYTGELGNPDHQRIMERHYGPLVQSLIDARPDIRFRWFGAPNYPWRGDNVQIGLPDEHDGLRWTATEADTEVGEHKF